MPFSMMPEEPVYGQVLFQHLRRTLQRREEHKGHVLNGEYFPAECVYCAGEEPLPDLRASGRL